MFKKAATVFTIFILAITLISCNSKPSSSDDGESLEKPNPNPALFANNLVGVLDLDTLKFGFIDSTGNYVIEPQYNFISKTFDSSGKAEVIKDDVYMTIDDKGKQLHDSDYGIYDGYTLSKNSDTGKFQLLNKSNKLIANIDSNSVKVTYSNDMILVNKGKGQVGIMGLDGKYIYDCIYGSQTQIINQNYVILETDKGLELADNKGNILTDPIYSNASYYSDPYNRDYIYLSNEENNQVYDIKDQQFVFDGLTIITPFNEYGIAKTIMQSSDNEMKTTYINTDGQNIIDPNYNFSKVISDGIIITSDKLLGSLPNNYKLYDNKGSLLYETDKYSVEDANSNYVLIRNDSSQYAIIDYDGNVMVDFGPANQKWMLLSDSGIYAKAKSDSASDAWDLYDINGNLLHGNVRFADQDKDFINGFIGITTENTNDCTTYEFLDETGKTYDSIQYKYSVINDHVNQFFSDGYAVVNALYSPNWIKWEIVDSKGDIVYTAGNIGVIWSNDYQVNVQYFDFDF